MDRPTITLYTRHLGEDINMSFDSELDMLNWLIDAGFKTHVKNNNGNVYFRKEDNTFASYYKKFKE
ncbi:hypothetical protein D3C85_630830 [compost metagenome]